MEFKQYTYLILHIITVLGPLSRSFEPKIQYYKKWKNISISILITAIFFILKDIYFTKWGIWTFNEKYVTGYKLFNLPIEEILFFFTVPFACVFIYEVVALFLKQKLTPKIESYIQHIGMVIMLIFCIIGWGKTYTFFYAFSAFLFLLIQTYWVRPKYLTTFYVSFLFHLIPFFIINGILTALPVVIYNNEENLNVRLFTIPIEDTIYSFLLLGINITIYQFLSNYKKSITP